MTAPSFTPEQEDRLREIIRDGILLAVEAMGGPMGAGAKMARERIAQDAVMRRQIESGEMAEYIKKRERLLRPEGAPAVLPLANGPDGVLSVR